MRQPPTSTRQAQNVCFIVSLRTAILATSAFVALQTPHWCLGQPVVDRPLIQTLSVTGTNFRTMEMWLPTQAGANYTAESKSQLLTDLAWSPVTNFVGNGSMMPMRDTGSDASRFYRVAVDPAPRIQTHPKSQTLAAGLPLKLTVEASGLPLLGWQWYGPGGILADDGRIAGGTTSNLTITNIAAPDAGSYWAVVSNYFGSATSGIAGIRITAGLSPRILVDPQKQILNTGQALSLWVSASGSLPLAYQWYGSAGPLSDGDRVTGSATTNVVIADIQLEDAGNYYVIVSNSTGIATSAIAGVRVEFGQAPRILVDPQSLDLNQGQLLSLWVSPSGQGTLSYSWYGPSGLLADGGRTSGATTTNLTTTSVDGGDAGNYWVVVANSFGMTTSAVASVRVELGQTPRIRVDPPSQTLDLGQLLSLTVTASGTEPLSYQWHGPAGILNDGGRVSGATTAALDITSFQAGDAGDYYVTVSNTFGTANSAISSVRVR